MTLAFTTASMFTHSCYEDFELQPVMYYLFVFVSNSLLLYFCSFNLLVESFTRGCHC